MAIEGIKNSGIAYQGSTSVPETTKAPVIKEAAPAQEAQKNVETVTAGKQNGLPNINVGDQQKEEENASSSQIKDAVDSINKQSANTEAVFGIHEGTNRVTIKIVDKNTRETIKEFPPEKTLDMIEKVWEMAGLMVDEKR